VRKELEENPFLAEVPQETQDVDAEAPPAPAPAEPASKETSAVDGKRADDCPST